MNLSEIYYLHEIGGKKNQEDYIWPVPGTASPDDKIFIVCDGVGGSENGEIASKIVAQSVGTALLKSAIREIDVPFINQLLSDARQKLIDYARQHQMSTRMATTFSLLIFIDEKAFISWCGDSRVYHIRKGEILYKTEDHSLVSTLVKSGEITAEDAQAHPQKNLLLRAVNADESDPEADGHWTEEVQDGDYFMLCTDGLLENIGERDIRFLLQQNDKGSIDLVSSVQKFCQDKTKDNYSMYLVKVKVEGKEDGVKKKKRYGWLVLLLVVLLGAAAFVIRENYFMPKKVMNVVVPVNISKDSMEKADSVIHAGAVSPTPASPVADTMAAARKDPAVTSKDSLAKKAMLNAKDSLAKKMVIRAKDSVAGKMVIPAKMKDSVGHNRDTIHPMKVVNTPKPLNKTDTTRRQKKEAGKKDSVSAPAQT